MTILYNFGDLESLSGAIQKAHGSVASLKSDIHSAAGKLQADWSGSASESWGTVQSKWNGACDNLTQALHQLSQKVMQSSDHMSQTEAKNAHLFDGV
ncbi:MAG: WXG100 family type VII secretion target [Actinocatenispora sp.]